MPELYTVERYDAGVELRLTRSHITRIRIWVNDDLAQDMVRSLTEAREAELRRQLPGEYDRVLSRLIALLRAVLSGNPGGSVEVPDDSTAFLPFLN